MDVKNSKLLEGALDWINSYTKPEVYRNSLDLCDGIALARVLGVVAPGQFSMQKIKVCNEFDFDFAQSNLTCVIRSIERYYNDVLKKYVISGSISTDSIAQKGPEAADELLKIIELLVGLAVQCEDRATHVGIIMALPLESQTSLQILIEAVMSRSFPLDTENESNVSDERTRRQNSLDELQSLIEEREKEVSDLHKTVNHVKDENRKVSKEKMLLEQKFQHVSKELKLANNNNAKLSKAEAEIEQYRQKVEKLSPLEDKIKELEKSNAKYLVDISMLQQKIDSLEISNVQYDKELSASKVNVNSLEIQNLRYGKDLLSSKENVKKLEEQNLNHTKELSLLKESIKKLEEQNTLYKYQVGCLEEALKEVAPLKEKLQLYENEKIELERAIHQKAKTFTLHQDESMEMCAPVYSSSGKQDAIEFDNRSAAHGAVGTGCACIIS